MIGFEGLSRMAELVRRAFGDDEICPPGITLEADRPEWALLKRERLWSLRANQAALAANFNKFVIQPNIGSPPGTYITTLTHIRSTVDAWLCIAEAVIVATAGAFANLRDGRRGYGKKVSTRIFVRQDAALTGAGDAFLLVPANTWFECPPFITVDNATPNAGILVQSTVVNVAQEIYCAGYERNCRVEESADV